MSYFNSQPHEEADLRDPVFKNSLYISTHSLTKRLTILFSSFCSLLVFQLTASRRGWHISSGTFTADSDFNSQPHEEADITTHWWFMMQHHFNSQPHEEADYPPSVSRIGASHFNSQPHEEADRLQEEMSMINLAFQLTASRRGWRQSVHCPLLSDVFQLTASRRGWRNRSKTRFTCRYFNSQPHEEADFNYIFHIIISHISTHSLTKRLTITFVRMT